MHANSRGRWLTGFLLIGLVAGAEAGTDDWIIRDLVGGLARAGQNFSDNRVKDRLRALEAAAGSQSLPVSTRPDSDVIADAQRDLAVARYTSMPEAERRRLLVAGMTRPDYLRPSLRQSPEFERIRDQSILYYLENFASPQLEVLHVAARKDPGDVEVTRLYSDAFLAELATLRNEPDHRFPPMDANAAESLRKQVEAIRMPDAKETAQAQLRANPLRITPALAEQFDRVNAVRRSLDAGYRAGDSSALTRDQSGMTSGATMLATARQAQRIAISDPKNAGHLIQKTLGDAVVKGDLGAVARLAGVATDHASWVGWDDIALWAPTIAGTALGVAIGVLAAPTVLGAVGTVAVAGGIGFLAGGFVGLLASDLLAGTSRERRLEKRIAPIQHDLTRPAPALRAVEDGISMEGLNRRP